MTEEWADDAVHVGAEHYSIGRDATLRATTVQLGGDLVRVCSTVRYAGPGGDAERTVAVGAVRRSGDTPTDGSQKPPAGDRSTTAEGAKADVEPPTTANPAAGRGPARPGPEGARNGSGQAGHGQNGRNGASSASEPSSQGGEKGNGATRNGSGAATGDKGRTGAAQPSTGTRSS